MLLLADRGVFSYAPWRKATQTGADLLWQIRTDRSVYQPHHLEDLADGSWLATLRWRRTCSPAAAPSARSRFSSSPSPLDSLRIATAEGLIMVGLTLEADQTDAQRRIDLAVRDFPSALFYPVATSAPIGCPTPTDHSTTPVGARQDPLSPDPSAEDARRRNPGRTVAEVLAKVSASAKASTSGRRPMTIASVPNRGCPHAAGLVAARRMGAVPGVERGGGPARQRHRLRRTPDGR